MKADVREWAEHKLNHHSWEQWREENPAEVEALRASLDSLIVHGEVDASEEIP